MRTRNVKIISNETLIKQKSNSENVFFKKKQNLLQTETLKKKGKKIKKKSSPVIEKSKAEKASSSCLRAPLQPAR
jgi:predicted secreted protein